MKVLASSTHLYIPFQTNYFFLPWKCCYLAGCPGWNWTDSLIILPCRVSNFHRIHTLHNKPAMAIYVTIIQTITDLKRYGKAFKTKNIVASFWSVESIHLCTHSYKNFLSIFLPSSQSGRGTFAVLRSEIKSQTYICIYNMYTHTHTHTYM